VEVDAMAGSTATPPGTIGKDSITTIARTMANSYLLRGEQGFVMVDTGLPNRRADIDRAIEGAGCRPGGLRLVVLTHGDYDHAGNAVHLRAIHGAKLAIHRDDAARVRRGDWSYGFKPRPDRFLLAFRVVGALVKPGPFDTFEPDVYLEEGQSLAPYGYDGEIVHLPGHTRGSVGVVTRDRDILCGDLLMNMLGGPGLEFFIDDLAAATDSVERLRTLGARTVYPGHGKAFDFAKLKVRR
jgi:hydroxyacylglutathione hydrolase